jgi:ATP-dependent helicase HrpB
MKPPLPIDPRLAEIRERLAERRAVVVVAPPGAGKTTRVPPAVAGEGAVIVLQPRRIAARSLAARIADENGWRVGEEVGWQVRFERRFTPRTRILVATEGVLTARLQSDPLAGAFKTIVLDEFHERSIHADLALALARQAWLARDDLRIVVMSATLDAVPVARFLDDAPVVVVEGRPHPVEIAYAPGRQLADAIEDEAARSDGHVLVFLPGAGEIRAAAERLGGRRLAREMRILPLHGRLSAEAQDTALRPGPERKILLATNVAETSITVDGVTSVVDTGLHRVPRLDVALGIDRLGIERISRDAADQRAGRAGRTRPGRALRLWDARDILRDHREPEIARIDLCSPLLDILAWGGSPLAFPWFEPPPADRVVAALELLRALGAVDDTGLTSLGLLLSAIPLPPRLARTLVAAGGTPLAAAACAVLSERVMPRGPLPAGASDVLSRAERTTDDAPQLARAAAEITAAFDRLRADRRFAASIAVAQLDEPDAERRLLHALVTGFPDRLARRREPGSRRLLLGSGHGAVLDRDSVVHDGEFLLAIDVEAAPRGTAAEARVRMASRVDPEWLPPALVTVEHRFDPATQKVRALASARIGGLVISEHDVAPDRERCEALLREAFIARGITADQSEAAARLRFAGVAPDLPSAAQVACAGAATLPPLDLWATLPEAARHAVSKAAPASIPLPSGRSARLRYRDDGSVVAAVKLQELFGLAETPRVGARRDPVVFELLAPNGRAVQTTRDLRSFWETTYPAVRRELRGRYPRHPWPEDPWTAPATHRTKPR